MALTIATPIDPSGSQGVFNNLRVVPHLGTFAFANLPTTMPDGTALPVGAMCTINNATSVVRGAATTGGGAVVMQIFWDGATWRN